MKSFVWCFELRYEGDILCAYVYYLFVFCFFVGHFIQLGFPWDIKLSNPVFKKEPGRVRADRKEQGGIGAFTHGQPLHSGG